MSTRPIAAAATLILTLAACAGGPPATGPAATAPVGTGAAATASQPLTTGAAIDLSDVDVCALVGDAAAATLTGETGFATDSSSDASSASCFWAVTRPGVPQYLEVRVFRRASLADYTLNIPGATCTNTAVSGVGTEAKGGVCTGAQTKVYLVAMSSGVAVQVIVNEPKGTLTPADLANAVNAVIAGLG